MKLQLAVLPTTQVLLLENVPDQYVDAVRRLGFQKRPNGNNWIKPNATQLNPNEFKREFPKLLIREHDKSEYLIRVEPPKRNDGTDAKSSMLHDTEANSFVLLGYNRQGQRIVEEFGERIFIDARGNRIKESSQAISNPGMFLRANDDVSFTMCAESFLETALKTHGSDQFISIEKFMTTIGVMPSRKSHFISAINEAAIRLVGRKGIKTLQDRLSVSIGITRALEKYDLGQKVKFDQVVMGRRLLGLDRDLLGHSIYVTGGRSDLFDQFKPKAVRNAETISDADFVLSIADDEQSAFIDLQERKPGSMTVTFVPTADLESASNVLVNFAKHGPIESAALVDLGQSSKFLAVTSLIGDPAQVPEISVINDEVSFWSWASLTVSDRARAMENVRSGLSTAANLTSASMAQNSHQVPYKSASKTSEPITMVPKELDEATRSALNRLVESFEDVDSRVAIECGIPREELGERLSPEQVDGVGLAIHAEERGRAFLFADNTGVGKGRALMALVKRAVLQGRKVLVLTEKAMNLSDLMRDLKHINALGDVMPVVMNQDATLIDESSGKPFDLGDRSILEKAIEEKTWPDSIPVVFATYSQFNQSPDISPRSAWLREVVDADTLVVGDEIHVAASGSSNTSENIAHAIEASGPPVLASATFAGDARAMAFFERLFPYGMSGAEIAAMMRKGGEQFMEVVSAMLVTDGVMIRREKDMSKLAISQHLDSERVERNREHMDALASVIGEMAVLSGEMDRVVNARNNDSGGILKGIQLKRMGFGSPLYTMTRLFSAALLAEYAAERAVTALQNGEKPIVLVENTIQGILKDAEIDGGDAPDFKDVMRRILAQLTKMSFTNDDGDTNRVDAAEGNENMQVTLLRINQMIDQLPDLPASAIDVVKSKIRDAGYSCGEITGRVLEVIDGKVVSRKDRNITKTKNAFNAGEIDALIINSAGSTGIDLHASRRFKDQRRRVMIELQGPAYVLKQIQAYGRVSRYDEVVPSRVEVLSTGLPVEVRLSAMRNQKLRRLSANVTSNRDSIFLTKNIPDLINSVGDQVVSKYAEMRPDLVKKLCLSYAEDDGTVKVPGKSDEVQSESSQDNDRSANEFMARLALLPTDYQEKVLSELTAEYELHIAELEARGENPLRPKELEGMVHIRDARLFEGNENSASITAFDGPMHIRDVVIERVAESIRSEALMAAVEAGTEIYGKVEQAAINITENPEVYLEIYMPKNIRTVQEALDKNNQKLMQIKRDMEITAEALRTLIPGREIELTHGLDSEKIKAIVTSVSAPYAGYHHLRSQYRVSIAIPGNTHINSVRLSTLLQDMQVATFEKNGSVKFNVFDGLTGADYEKILENFESASAKKLTPARILSTNIFRAVRLAAKYNLGQMISYVDSEGNRHRGVMVKKNFESHLEKLPVRLDGMDQAYNALVDKRVEVTNSATTARNSIKISPFGNETWNLSIPSPRNNRSGRKWPSEEFKELFERGEITENINSMIAINSTNELRDALEILVNSGLNTFYVDSKYRKDFVEENMYQESTVEMIA
jgi:hypothetical protein